MNLLTAAILILSVIVVYFVLVKVYTVLFQITGLSKEKAKFQVISLLTNCGFTTRESEIITSTKSRRKIGVATMLTGNIFSILIVSLFINLFLSFKKDELQGSLLYFGIAFGIFFLFLIISKIPFIDRGIDRVIEGTYHKFARDNEKNVVTLVDNFDHEAICRVILNIMPEILLEKSLAASKLTAKYNLNVLSIQRKSKTIKVSKDVILQKGDIISVFGNYQTIRDLFLNGDLVKPEEIAPTENVIDLNDYYGGNAIATITLNHLPESIDDKTLEDLDLSKKHSINVLYVKRNDELSPISGQFIFMKNDEVTVFGPYDKIKELFL